MRLAGCLNLAQMSGFFTHPLGAMTATQTRRAQRQLIRTRESFEHAALSRTARTEATLLRARR